MKREQLMEQAQRIMTTYASKGLGGETRLEVKRLVGQFFSDHVSRLDKATIMDHMATPMKALAWFNTYLCDAFRKRCCNDPASGDADTCRLT
jgi:hypothetical protein